MLNVQKMQTLQGNIVENDISQDWRVKIKQIKSSDLYLSGFLYA